MTVERETAVATRSETRVVYAAGVVQGIALVTFPALSSVFTDPAKYGLSTSAYGAIFLPQAVLAITFSLLSAGLSRRVEIRTLYLFGLAANLAAMLLLAASSLFTEDQSIAYPMLLAGTASLGMGFGLTVPAINTLTAAFHPDRVDGSVLVLNALLGLGTALAPVLVAIFVGVGFWWGLPVMSSALLVGLLLVSVRLPLRIGAPDDSVPRGERVRLPGRFWLFAGFALLYGICETMNGNWSQVDMTENLGASPEVASLALTAFWAMVTVGRVGFALIQRRFPTTSTYRALPFVLAAAFVAIASLPPDEPVPAVLAFALAGLGCSALLPLTISFGEQQMVAISAGVAGGVIAFYQMGYGIAAFGAGPLQAAGVSLPTLYGIAAAVAAVMGLLSFAVVGRSRRHAPPEARHASGLSAPPSG